jgi:hypothetical protein
MSDKDIFGKLDEATEEASSGGDYADWWDPEDSGERLVGVIVEMHSAPENWTEPGEVPDTIYTVVSVGRGDVPEGQAVTPKQHKQLKKGLEGAGLMDLVQLKFTGYQSVDGQPQPMMTYEVGVIPQEEWESLDGADDIEEAVEGHSGPSGDNRRTEPYTSVGSTAGSSGSSDSSGNDELMQAADALKDLVSIQGGEVGLEQAERIITEVRGFDVDIGDAAVAAGLEQDGGTLRQS